MEEGRRRYDSSSSPFSLLAKLQILGWGCQPHYLEGKESWFPTPGSWWGPCAATLACCVWMRSLSLTGTLGPGWPLGGVCAHCLTRMWWGQLLSQCPSPGEAERATAGPAAGQLPFLRGCLPARWCLMQSKAGLSAGILASLSLGDLKMGLGPSVTLAQAKAGHKEKVDLKEIASLGKLLRGQKAKASGTEPDIDEGKN